MQRVVATFAVVVVWVLLAGAANVRSQEACRFTAGFEKLRSAVGEKIVGECLEDEHFNVENGNAEQRTTGGLLVWRKADNLTAFTDGSTTWLNGPNGIQNRPNNERFSWETEPATSTQASAAATPPASPAAARTSASSSLASTDAGSQIAAASPAAASPASVSVAAASPTATPTATNTATPAATPTKTPTLTPTKPAVTVKFTEKPDDVDTGSDATFKIETSAKKGTCTFSVTYRNTVLTTIGTKDIEDGECEFKFTIPGDTKTGKAKASIGITATAGNATADEEFTVKKGDSVLGGSVDLEVEADDLPDEVGVGEEFEIKVDTDLKNRGTCDVSITWPKVAATSGEQKEPDGSGKCSWKMTVPADIPKKGTATMTITVRKNSSTYRTLTKEFEVKK